MKKLWGIISIIALLTVIVTGCGSNNTTNQSASIPADQTAASTEQSAPTAEEPTERTIEYLGETYTVPANVERIVITGSIEAHEDALVLDVHPVGAVSFSGQFPERFASILDQAQSIGEKTEPNFETILSLKPDVILGTTKFPEEVVEQLKKIAPTILVSHIATDWEANIQMLGELTGKTAQAEEAIANYKTKIESAKSTLTDKLQDKEVVALRVRSGKLFMYPSTVFYNSFLYGDLGLKIPETITAVKAQEALSIEQLAAMNPDYLILQSATDENADNQNALQELLDNPIIQQITAAKEDHIYVNLVDPLSEGGPAWSRINFLDALLDKLGQ